MNSPLTAVPVSLLLDPDWPPAAKLVWITQNLHPGASQAELERLTGLSRNTVAAGVARVGNRRPPGGRKVYLPVALLAERALGAQAKVLYGLLQAIAEEGQFTHSALHESTGLAVNTLKRALTDLVEAGWVHLTPGATRLAPIRFALGNPEQQRRQAEYAVAKRRVKRAENTGEAIMQEYLSLLIDSDQFTDNARPGFLVNPLTGERLELDRYYMPDVGFEHNGAQHYRKTGRYTQAQADAQHLRDLIKAGLCLYQGIRLVIVHPEDLTLESMRRKVGQLLPLRDLTGQEQLIDFLEEESFVYRAAAKNG